MYHKITRENVSLFPVGTKLTLHYGVMHGSEEATVTGVKQDMWGTSLITEKASGELHYVNGVHVINGVSYEIGAHYRK